MSMASIFILVSFFLGILTGSVVTYAVMSKVFADALDDVSKESKEATHDLKVAKDKAVKTNRKSLMLVIVTIGALALVIAVSYFVAQSGYRPTTQGQENLGKSLENPDNSNALKGLADGVKRAN
jgi:flagellar basal body-associated protein FliL